MRIFFQNPTKGPLITVSFDAGDGASLAFVPAAMDCGAKSVTAGAVGVTAGASLTGIMAAATLFPGDSSPKPPRQGINRFAPKATADGVDVTRIAPTPAAAVDLPSEPTKSATTVADATAKDNLQFLNDLRTQVANSPILTSAQKDDMNRLIDRALQGDASILDVAKMAWTLMAEDMVSKLRAAGVEVKVVETPNGQMYEIIYDRRKGDALLSPIYTHVNALKLATGDSRLLSSTDDQYIFVMRLPSWEYMFNTYGEWLKNVQFVARNISPDDVYVFHTRGLALAQIALTNQKPFEQHGIENVHGLIFLGHDLYHAIHWNRLSEDVKAVLLELYPIIKERLVGLFRCFTQRYDDLVELIVDADHSNLSLENLIAMAMTKLAAIAEGLSHFSEPDRHSAILMALRERLLGYDQSTFSDRHRDAIHKMADRVEKRCTGQPLRDMIFCVRGRD